MTTKPKIFKPEDFREIFTRIMREGYKSANAGDMWEPNQRPDDIADIANRKIESLRSIQVWGTIGEHGSSWSSHKPGTYIQENYNHTAYLFDIQKLPEKECEHKAYIEYSPHALGVYPEKAICVICGVELTARWEAKK